MKYNISMSASIALVYFARYVATVPFIFDCLSLRVLSPHILRVSLLPRLLLGVWQSRMAGSGLVIS